MNGPTIHQRICLAALLGLSLLGAGCTTQNRQDQAVEHYIRGQLLLDQGQTQAALEELAKAVGADPALSVARSAMGDLYRRQGQHELAGRAYEAAVQANPYTFRTQYNLALTYQTLADQAKLAAKVREYLEKAVAVYQRALELQPSDFDSHVNLAVCHFQLGQKDEARQHSQEAVRLDPKSAKARANLGIIYDSEGDLYEAISAYKAAMELRPNDPDLLMKLGQAYIKQGRLRPAISTFEHAGKVAPRESWPWEKLAECNYYAGQYEASLEKYRQAIEVNGHSCVGYRGLGVVYMTQFVKDPQREDLRDKGLEAWHASLEINSNQPDLRRLVEKYSPKLNRPAL